MQASGNEQLAPAFHVTVEKQRQQMQGKQDIKEIRRQSRHMNENKQSMKGLNRGVNYDPESKQEPRFSKQVKDESYQKGTAKGSFK